MLVVKKSTGCIREVDGRSKAVQKTLYMEFFFILRTREVFLSRMRGCLALLFRWIR